MKKTLIALGVTLALVVSIGGALAEEGDDSRPTAILDPNNQFTGVLKLALKHEVAEQKDDDPMPAPILAPPKLTATAAKAGPVGSATRSETPSFGGAIVTPRGGAMSTPKQLADRQINRLIRRLN